jgi:hypothetical protein
VALPSRQDVADIPPHPLPPQWGFGP